MFQKSNLRQIKDLKKPNIINLNNNLATILKRRNINLYFMLAFDKYNLYSKYIVNNKYGVSTFIDTKAILEKEIDRGLKDIFYADDTHWSYKASESIVNHLKEFNDIKK